jgi:fermentation-respiration switch protein FrsA (DUF1100 family)
MRQGECPGGPRWLRLLIRVAGTATLAFLLLALMVMLFESRIVYHPSRWPEGPWEIAERDPTVKEVEFLASDGTRLVAWHYAPPALGGNSAGSGGGRPACGAREAPEAGSAPAVLFLHGNAGNVAWWHETAAALAALGAEVLSLDYRGFGKSDGSPSERGLCLDAEAGYDWLVSRGVAPCRLVIHGVSLGGAVAADLAARRPCAGVILQSTFTSARDMASAMLPVFPARWFMRSRYDTLAKIPCIEAPKLIIHSRDDEMIPFEMAERLLAAAKEPKALVAFREAGHNDLLWRCGRELDAALAAFLQRTVPPQAAPAP